MLSDERIERIAKEASPSRLAGSGSFYRQTVKANVRRYLEALSDEDLVGILREREWLVGYVTTAQNGATGFSQGPIGHHSERPVFAPPTREGEE